MQLHPYPYNPVIPNARGPEDDGDGVCTARISTGSRRGKGPGIRYGIDVHVRGRRWADLMVCPHICMYALEQPRSLLAARLACCTTVPEALAESKLVGAVSFVTDTLHYTAIGAGDRP